MSDATREDDRPTAAARADGPDPAPHAAVPDTAGPHVGDAAHTVARLATGPGPDDHVPVTRAQISDAMGQLRDLHEQGVRPDEGLRERKKRLTRQQISDTATWMFVARGFDEVRVAEVAAEAGVSEKTVFNYFPTKESLVFDRTDDLVAGIRAALTERGPDESPTQAMVAFIERECAFFDELGPEFRPMFLAFLRLIDETPALRVAQQGVGAQMADATREALAESVGVDPRDPEPLVAAHALMGLWEVQSVSRERHIRAGTPQEEFLPAVLEETRRAARLLDAGLTGWLGPAGAGR